MHLAVFKWIFNYVEITIVLQHFTTSLDNISGDKYHFNGLIFRYKCIILHCK